MPLIINLETATKNCSVALSRDGETLFCKEVANQDYSHAEKLHVFINDVLAESDYSANQLDAVAVSRGPGSYTGLRIGVSAAKGLCFALDVPLISIDTLQVLAAQANVSSGLIVPMIDARRMEVYSAVFSHDLQLVREIKAEILSEDSFTELEDTTYFVGDSSLKAKSVMPSRPNFVFVDDVVFPSARTMSALSHKKFLADDFEDVAYFEPFYLKDFLITQPAKK